MKPDFRFDLQEHFPPEMVAMICKFSSSIKFIVTLIKFYGFYGSHGNFYGIWRLFTICCFKCFMRVTKCFECAKCMGNLFDDWSWYFVILVIFFDYLWFLWTDRVAGRSGQEVLLDFFVLCFMWHLKVIY